MQLVYMPNLVLGNKEEIHVGDVRVWNFGKKALDYIPDDDLREHIGSIIECNIREGKPVTDVGIINIGKPDFRDLNKSEIETAYETGLLLFIACLSHSVPLMRGPNAGHWVRTSENFDIGIQDFQVGNQHIAEISGYVVQITAGGYKIGEKKFYAPPCLLRPSGFWLDEELLEDLVTLAQKSPKRLFSRIVRATELFRQSYYNHTNVSIQARILLHIAAFETLLELPRSNRKNFKDKLEDYCAPPSEPKYDHHYETKFGAPKKCEYRTMKGIWADEYYTLRNHIIHGLEVRDSELVFRKTMRHFDIAAMFFVLVVKKLVSDRLRGGLLYDEIIWHPRGRDRLRKGEFEYKRNIIKRALTESRANSGARRSSYNSRPL